MEERNGSRSPYCVPFWKMTQGARIVFPISFVTTICAVEWHCLLLSNKKSHKLCMSVCSGNKLDTKIPAICHLLIILQNNKSKVARCFLELWILYIWTLQGYLSSGFTHSLKILKADSHGDTLVYREPMTTMSIQLLTVIAQTLGAFSVPPGLTSTGSESGNDLCLTQVP